MRCFQTIRERRELSHRLLPASADTTKRLFWHARIPIEFICASGHFIVHEQRTHDLPSGPTAPVVEPFGRLRNPCSWSVVPRQSWVQVSGAFRAIGEPRGATAKRPNIMTRRRRHQFAVPAGSARVPAAMRHRVPRETRFATGPSVPASEPRENQSRRTAGTAANDDTSGSRPGKLLKAGLLRFCLKVLPANWLVPRWRAVPGESVVASRGSVEIRQIPAGCVAQTCVKGEPAQARETALRRLAKYTHGNNRSSAILDTVRPVMQRQQAPGRWLIGVRLAKFDDTLTAPAPCEPKVKLISRAPEMLAVVRVAGRPAHGSVTAGDAIILNAIDGTDWIATGSPMIRLHARGPLPWLGSGFEVAVPVAPRCAPAVQHGVG